MSRESNDRRALGAFKLVDGTTGVPIPSSIRIDAEGARFVRNPSGWYAILDAPGLTPLTRVFQHQPDAVDGTTLELESVPLELTLSDPGRRYLARRATLRLPLDPDPENASHESSLFFVRPIPMYPAPAAPSGSSWAPVRVAVIEAGGPRRLPYALVRVVRSSDATLLARGLADGRGEAFVPVPGLKVTTWSDDEDSDSVMASETQVVVDVFYDPALAGPIDLDAGQTVDPRIVPDPDDLEARRATLRSVRSGTVALATGRGVNLELFVALS